MGEFPEFQHYPCPTTGKPRWRHLQSGRTGWVISGGSDVMADAPAEPAVTEPADTGAPADVTPPNPGAPADPTPAADGGGQSTGGRPLSAFSHEELVALATKLQKENVTKKERYAPFEQAFANVPEQDRQNYLTFAAYMTSGDAGKIELAAKWMRENLDLLSPAQQAAVEAVADAASQEAGGDDEFDPFDRESIEKLADERAEAKITAILEQREQAQRDREAQQSATKQMGEFVDELADKHSIPGFKDAEDVDFKLLMVTAQSLDRNLPWKERLSAAAEAVAERKAADAKAYMQKKSAEADVPAVPPEGGAPSGSKTPLTIKDGSKAAEARLKAIQAGPGNTPT